LIFNGIKEPRLHVIRHNIAPNVDYNTVHSSKQIENMSPSRLVALSTPRALTHAGSAHSKHSILQLQIRMLQEGRKTRLKHVHPKFCLLFQTA